MVLTRLLLLTILCACGAIVQGQTLGEAAQKEKERRAKQSGSAKTYTDTDLQDAASKRSKEGLPSPASGVPPFAAPTTAKPSGVVSPSQDSAAAPDPTQTERASKKARGDYYKGQLAETDAGLKAAEAALK